MARTRKWDVRTDGQTDGRTGRTGVTLNALPLFFEYRGGGKKMQELSSLFMTHHINVMHALVKFHEYIPYRLGVMARTRLTIWNLVKGK